MISTFRTSDFQISGSAISSHKNIHLLSRHIDEDQGSLLRSDILENLGRRHYGSPAYQLFKELQYDGGDPMEFRDYLVKVQKACKGEWPCWH